MARQITIFLVIVMIVTTKCAWLDVTAEQKETIDKYNRECAVDSQVDLNLIEQAKNGTFTDDPKVKAHGFCFSKKLGFQNSNGEIQEQRIRDKLKTKMDDGEKVAEIINKCCKPLDTPEETGYQLLKCLQLNVPAGVVYVD